MYIIIRPISYSENRSRSVFLLSFISDLWTHRNVAVMILTPPPVKNSCRSSVDIMSTFAVAQRHLAANGNRSEDDNSQREQISNK